jgi:hypothetical protein
MLLKSFFCLSAYLTENTPKNKGNHACYTTVSSASAGISQRVQKTALVTITQSQQGATDMLNHMQEGQMYKGY